ncbi:MAG: hypothetical protein K6L76_02365 [Agarilytica sp.]
MKRVFGFVLIFFAVSVNTFGGSVSDYYFLSVSSENLNSRIKLNGIPLFETASMSSSQDQPVNIWLMPANNKIEVSAEVIDRKLPHSLMASLFLHDSKEETPTPKLEFFVFDLAKTYPDKDVYTFKYSIDINERFPKLTEVWSSGGRITEVKKQDVGQMVSIVKSLEKNIKENNIDEALKILDYKISEDARSEGKDKIRILDASKESFSFLFSQQNIKSFSVSDDNVAYEIVGGSHLVRLFSKSGAEALRLESDEFEFEIPIYFARKQEKWVIAR